jgi:hypothetical protein
LPGSFTYTTKTRAVHYISYQDKVVAIPEKQIESVNNFLVEKMAAEEASGSGY